MTINWTALVTDSVPETPENPTSGGLFPQKVGTLSEEVGTNFTTQHIEEERLFVSVPTVPTVPSVFEEDRARDDENKNSSSYSKPAGDGDEGRSAPQGKARESSCLTCRYLSRPGLSDGYCGGRDDLPYAYTSGHPLRQCPADQGAECPAWELHPYA